jgi:hypothetical protein
MSMDLSPALEFGLSSFIILETPKTALISG